MGRSIPIFRALVETKEAETSHWWHASLAYCLKDQAEPDYAEAEKWLTKAIEVRDAENNATKTGAYEFNRAICNIELARGRPDGRGLDKQIENDRDFVARHSSRFATVIASNPTTSEWLRRMGQGAGAQVSSRCR